MLRLRASISMFFLPEFAASITVVLSKRFTPSAPTQGPRCRIPVPHAQLSPALGKGNDHRRFEQFGRT
jgi:hypothetical protein